MEVIVMETKAFNQLVEKAVQAAVEIAKVEALPEFIPRRKAMEVLGCKETTLNKLVHEGKISMSKDPDMKFTWFETASINNYLRSNIRRSVYKSNKK